MAACPHLSEIERLLTGEHGGGQLAALEQHLATCAECRHRLDTIADVSDLLPGQAERPRDRQSPSGALARAMHDLEKLGAGSDSEPARAGIQLSFLTSSDRAGFLGKLGDYEVRRIIGQGGMGVVLEAYDPPLKRTVAIKVLGPWMAADADAQQRFHREAQTVAALVHENIVPIHAVAQSNGVLYLVFEHVAGESLADRLDREGKLPLVDIQRIGSQVARGLAVAHREGHLHRDLKPANILIAADTGRVKLADFGLAKYKGSDSLTLSGTVMGTPEFMSPEQALGKPADERSDLFSLGAVLYLCASGVSPFRGQSLLDSLDKVRQLQPQPLAELDPSLPAWFTALVQRLLSKEPDERPSSAAEVAQILAQSLPPGTVVDLPAQQGTIRARPAVRDRRGTRWRRWLLVPLILGAVAVAVAVAIPAGWFFPVTPGGEPNTNEPAKNPPPIIAGFTIGGQDKVHQTLQEALAAAEDNDIIEVHGDGPYLTPPLTIAGKRLTIRAAANAEPKFLAENPAVPSARGFVETDSDLRLEGLEIQWALASPPGLTEADILARSIVVCTHGRLAVSHCRIVSDRLNGCVAGSCRNLIVRNSHFLAKNGLGIFWRPEPGGGLDIENCILESRFGITLLMDRAPSTTAPGPVRLSQSTLAADRGIQVMLESQPRQPLRFSADHNLLACDHLFVIMAQPRAARARPNARQEEVGALLRMAIDWSEEANVHRRGMKYLARPRMGRPGELLSADFTGIDRWLGMWELPASQSVEADIRFQPRDADSRTSPLMLESIHSASGEVPARVGEAAGEVGPGAAYHAWRLSAAYAKWPPHRE